MQRFQNHTIESAPEQSRAVMTAVEKGTGFRSSLLGIMSEAPGVLNGFAQLGQLFAQSTLNPLEREVVIMTIGRENDCAYCMAYHTFLCRKLKVPDEVVTSLRTGAPLADPRLQVLSEFTRTVVHDKGYVSDELWQRFMAQGFTRANALEVILALGAQVLSNYSNHMGGAELEPVLKEFEWSKAELKAAAHS